MSIARTVQPDPPVYTITKFQPDPPAPKPTPGFRLWEKAVITIGALAAPAPVVACLAGGNAGWTAVLMAVGATTVVGTVVHHGLAEDRPAREPAEPLVGVAWSDYGDITERTR